MVISAFTLSVVASVLGISGFFIAFGGGYLGIFLVWSACALGIPAGILLWLGAFKGKQRRKLAITVAIAGFLVLGISILTGYSYFQAQLHYPFQSLVPHATKEDGSGTLIECHFGKVRYFILDPQNQIRFRQGPPPATVEFEEGLRVVRFIDSDVSLHCASNTIFLSSQGGEIGGWMGANFAPQSRVFRVDRNSSIQPAYEINP